jgi:octaprenyl-diphosphate synthase
LKEGKATLPLLIAMQRGSPEQRQLLRLAIQDGDAERLPEVIAIVRSTGSIEATRDVAREQAELAQASLSVLPPSVQKDALIELARSSVDRSH